MITIRPPHFGEPEATSDVHGTHVYIHDFGTILLTHSEQPSRPDPWRIARLVAVVEEMREGGRETVRRLHDHEGILTVYFSQPQGQWFPEDTWLEALYDAEQAWRGMAEEDVEYRLDWIDEEEKMQDPTNPTQTKASNPKDVLAADESRCPLDLIPSPALIHLAQALGDGARKYGPYNWREEGVGTRTYVGAALRHTLAYLDGERNARDSGVHHLGHAMACLAIILDAEAVGNLVDNRPLPAPTADMLEEIKRRAKGL